MNPTPVHNLTSSILGSHAGHASLPQNVGESERLMSTVAGAALVLAGLSRGRACGLVMTLSGGAMLYRAWTGHCHLYDSLGIDTTERNQATAIASGQGTKVEKTIVINRPNDELYAFWRNFENLPRVMQHLERVEVIGAKRSRWFASGIMGKKVQWEAEVINERAPEIIAWRSLPGSEVETAGSVRFRPLGDSRSTSLTVSMSYNPPAGKLGAAIASLLGKGLEQQLESDLHEFKRLMESGEAISIASNGRNEIAKNRR